MRAVSGFHRALVVGSFDDGFIGLFRSAQPREAAEQRRWDAWASRSSASVVSEAHFRSEAIRSGLQLYGDAMRDLLAQADWVKWNREMHYDPV